MTVKTDTQAAFDRLAVNGATMTTDDPYVRIGTGRVEFQIGLPRLSRDEAVHVANAVCDALEAIKAARETAQVLKNL